MPYAAIMTAFNEPLIVDEIDVQEPRAGELRVKMGASGVCHSDLTIWGGSMPFPIPMVLGHEGAATVLDVGEGVSGFAPGDHVVLSAIPQCGVCFFCQRGQPVHCVQSYTQMQGGLLDGATRMLWKGQPMHQFCMAGTFAEESIVPATSAVKIQPDMPFAPASLVGCGVVTGWGAANHVADIAAGDTVAVVGCGGVGLNVVQGAKLAGAGRIIAVDMLPFKLELAKSFGATDTVNASDGDPVESVRALTGGMGVDVAFDASGVTTAERQMVDMTRPGGQSVFVGMPPGDKEFSIPATFGFIALGKTLKGCLYGGTNIQRDFPHLCESYTSGDLMLDELISKRITLDQVNDAFHDMEAGEVARSVIVYE